MKKIIWFDTETTGLDPIRNDIIQLAGIITIDREVKEEFNFNIQPFNYDNISEEAIATHGITIEQMKLFPQPHRIKILFSKLLDKYIDRYDKNDKFTPAGYNVRFDMDFLHNFFKKNNDNYFFSYITGYPLDVYSLILNLYHFGLFPKLPNFKLGTIGKYFDLKIDTHEALSDIKATREIANMILKKLKMEEK